MGLSILQLISHYIHLQVPFVEFCLTATMLQVRCFKMAGSLLSNQNTEMSENTTTEIILMNHGDTALIKVIPLKLFYYQTFLKLGAMNIHNMNIIKMQLKNGVTVLVYASAGP